MGNFSSCTSSSKFHATSVLASSPPQINTSPAAARVLLMDGGALTFITPIKVISLLLDYPFHVICPLDSLRPGQHSLSSLLPDEELELGQLYLLLPLKTFENRESMPNMAPLIRRSWEKRPISSTQQPRLIKNQLSMLLDVPIRDHRGPKLEEKFAAIRECEESARLLPEDRSDVGSSNVDDLDKNMYVGDVGAGKCGRHVDMGDNVLSGEKHRSRRLTSAATFSDSFRERQSLSGRNNARVRKNDEIDSRICDTAELQMAYRSIRLRRCRSWTPRLQPITENKLPKSATTLD